MRTKLEMLGQLRPAFSELDISSEGFEFDTEMVTNEVNFHMIIENKNLSDILMIETIWKLFVVWFIIARVWIFRLLHVIIISEYIQFYNREKCRRFDFFFVNMRIKEIFCFLCTRTYILKYFISCEEIYA